MLFLAKNIAHCSHISNVSNADAKEWWETLPPARTEPLMTPLAC